MHGVSRSMRLFSFPTEFIQSSYPDDEQSSSDLFLTPHPLSSSLSDRQESNATDRLTGQGCVKVLGGGGVEQCWLDEGLMFKLNSPSLGKDQSFFYFEGQRGGVVLYIYFFFNFFCQKPDKFLVTIHIGKKDRMELVSVFSTGCASPWEQGKEGATGHYGSEGWRLLACLHHLSALGSSPRGGEGVCCCSLTVPKGWLDLHFPAFGALLWELGGAGSWGLVLGTSLCPGCCSWAAAQGGLLPAAKSGEGPDLVFWVLWRLALACQEGKGAI